MTKATHALAAMRKADRMTTDGEDMVGRIGRIAVVLALAIATAGCTNSERARYELKRESENGYGVMRTVTAYSATGEQIGQWHGMIDVAYSYTGSESSCVDRVDIVVFDGDRAIDRVIVSGAIVVVDND